MLPTNRRRRRRTTGVDPSVRATWSEKDRQREAMHEALEMPLAETKLPVRVINTMEQNGVFLIKDLLEEDGDDLVNMRNLGEKTVREITQYVRSLGLEPPESWTKALKKKPPAAKNSTRKPDEQQPKISGHNYP